MGASNYVGRVGGLAAVLGIGAAVLYGCGAAAADPTAPAPTSAAASRTSAGSSPASRTNHDRASSAGATPTLHTGPRTRGHDPATPAPPTSPSTTGTAGTGASSSTGPSSTGSVPAAGSAPSTNPTTSPPVPADSPHTSPPPAHQSTRAHTTHPPATASTATATASTDTTTATNTTAATNTMDATNTAVPTTTPTRPSATARATTTTPTAATKAPEGSAPTMDKVASTTHSALAATAAVVPAVSASTVAAPTTRVVAAATTSLTLAQKLDQLGREATGLISDLSLGGISLVNNLAALTAAKIGREPLFGLPYDVATTIAHTTATLGQLVTGSPLTATTAGRFPVTYGIMNVLAVLDPQAAPAGANDPSITVTAAHPLPIILLNGTGSTQGVVWNVGAPVLADAGYKVFTFNYGNITSDPNFPLQATAAIPTAAQQLSNEVDTVLAQTGAPKVILVGLSEGGGMLPGYYLNDMGGAAKVSQLIGISPGNHGTDLDGLTYLQHLPILAPLVTGVLNLLGPVFLEEAQGSPTSLIDKVYGAGDTQPGVLYTTLTSTDDWVVTPYTNQALTGLNVINIIMQDQYPGLLASHIGMAFVSPTWTDVLAALAANPAANPQPATATA